MGFMIPFQLFELLWVPSGIDPVHGKQQHDLGLCVQESKQYDSFSEGTVCNLMTRFDVQ